MVIYKVTKEYIQVMDPADGEIHQYPHDAFKEIWTGVIILLMPAETFKAGNEKISHLRRFWLLLRPHKGGDHADHFRRRGIYHPGLAYFALCTKYSRPCIDRWQYPLTEYDGHSDAAHTRYKLFIGGFKSVFALKTGQQIDARLILGYYKHLLKLPQQFFDTMRVGEITSRITDAVKIRSFINETATGLVVNVFIVGFSFLVMFLYQWKLALLVLTIIPVYILLYFVSNRFNKKWQRTLMENNAELGSQLVESLNTVSTIKRFGLEEHANMKTESKFIRLLQTIFKTSIFNIYAGSLAELRHQPAGCGPIVDGRLYGREPQPERR